MFFETCQYEGYDKLQLAPLSMMGEVLAWFRWVKSRRKIRDWEEFKEFVVQKFRPFKEGSQYDRLLALKLGALKLGGSVEDYVRKFIELAAPIPEVPNAVPNAILESAFKTWLNRKVRNELIIMNPRNLEKMMILSQRIEIKNKEI